MHDIDYGENCGDLIVDIDDNTRLNKANEIKHFLYNFSATFSCFNVMFFFSWFFYQQK